MDDPKVPPPSVLAIVNDLFFQAKIGEVHRSLGVAIGFAKTPEGLAKVLARGPLSLALVDMSARGVDAEEAVRTLRRERPALHVVAFVSHVDQETKRRALEAGASEAWAKSRLERELPDLVRRWAPPEKRDTIVASEPHPPADGT